MENEIKYRYGQLRQLADDVDETRTVEFVISDETRDRHGTILKADRWQLDNFNANGIVGYQHNVYGGDLCNAPNPDDVIGKGSAFLEDGKLIGRVAFEPAELNPLAEKIFQKVKFGTLKATSVGFVETKEGEDEKIKMGDNEVETYVFGEQELVEFSIVNIPSNPKALKKSMRDQAANALTYIHKHLDGDFTFSDIEKMTVSDVIKNLNRDGLERDVKEKDDNEIIEQQRIKQEKLKVWNQNAEARLKLYEVKL